MDSQHYSLNVPGWTLETIVPSINYSYSIKEMSCVQRLGIITCIPKSNKPKQHLKQNLETTDVIKLSL